MPDSQSIETLLRFLIKDILSKELASGQGSPGQLDNLRQALSQILPKDENLRENLQGMVADRSLKTPARSVRDSSMEKISSEDKRDLQKIGVELEQE